MLTILRCIPCLIERERQAAVVFDEIFNTKRNISVPVGQNVVGQILNTTSYRLKIKSKNGVCILITIMSNEKAQGLWCLCDLLC